MSRREMLRNEMMEDIKDTARQQMAENGTAAISLSAISRKLGVSQPALYRYYSSRDDLVTALIIDAFTDLAVTLENTSQESSGASYHQRMAAIMRAYRAWALEHPLDFQLIYGNPIPGYHAPVEATTPAARRGFAVILAVLTQAYSAGVLLPHPRQQRAAEELVFSLPAEDYGQEKGLPALVSYLGVMGWYHIHGMIMLELFHHTQEIIPDSDAFYNFEIESLLTNLGMAP
jgi:AcrR family transcriptional regulator